MICRGGGTFLKTGRTILILKNVVGVGCCKHPKILILFSLVAEKRNHFLTISLFYQRFDDHGMGYMFWKKGRPLSAFFAPLIFILDRRCIWNASEVLITWRKHFLTTSNPNFFVSIDIHKPKNTHVYLIIIMEHLIWPPPQTSIYPWVTVFKYQGIGLNFWMKKLWWSIILLYSICLPKTALKIERQIVWIKDFFWWQCRHQMIFFGDLNDDCLCDCWHNSIS